MPIVGLGLDLADVERFEAACARRGERFLERLFTEDERAYCQKKKMSFQHYAGRFAVKEAVMKALGTGWRKGVRWIDIEVVRAPGQAPTVKLHGESARIAEGLGIARIHTTITHDGGLAAAVAIAESD